MNDLFGQQMIISNDSFMDNQSYEWIDLPEYNNINEPPPVITATFKFRNVQDFEKFKELAKEHIYNGEKLFDGNQQIDKKQSWFPLKEKSSKYKYISTDPKLPRFPIYIVSKGRYTKNPTSKTLMDMNVPFKMIVEEQEYEEYAKLVGKEKLLILPQKYKDNYDTFWNDNDPRVGPGAARNFAWDHSISEGHNWHWVMDDNLESFERFNNNQKIKCLDGTMFYVCEDFVLRYTNIAIAGPNYANFCHSHEARPPLITNTRIYSCLLIRNDIPYRWRGRYNEDTDLSLRALKDGWVTVQFNTFLQGKMATQKIGGGNTKEFYSEEGTKNKSQMLEDMHPDVAKVVWRFNRWHHHVDYKRFKGNKLIRKCDVNINNTNNEYGLIKVLKDQ